MATMIFVSYSHKDSRYLEDNSLLGHLKGLERDGARFWWDRKMPTGQVFDRAIERKIAQADIALLLVCQNHEMSACLSHARHRGGLFMFPVLLSACDWRQIDWLKSMNCMPRDGKNIEQHFHAPPGKRKAIFQEITDKLRERVMDIEKAKQQPASKDVAMNSISKSVNFINGMYGQLTSFSEGLPEQQKDHSVYYEGRGDRIVINNRGHQTTLLPSDLKKLSPRQLRHITIYQQELEASYDRWEKLYQRWRQETPAAREQTKKELSLVVGDMEEALSAVLDFIDALNIDIEDHYLMFRHLIETESAKLRLQTA